MTEADLLSDIDPVLRRDDPNASKATSPLTVYVAGPMRGIAEFNFPAFEEATTQLRYRGYAVISPAEQDLDRGFDPSGLTGHEDLSSLGFDLRQALIADLNHVAYECDAICLLPGWEDSKGARAELALAEALGLRVVNLEDALVEVDQPMTEHEFLHGLVRELWPPERLLTAHEEALAWFDRVTGGTYRALPAAGAVAARIGMTGPCDLRAPHDPHIETSGIVDNGGNIVLDQCPGQTAECANCDDRKCMDCVLRYQHDECREDCPDCCPNYRSDLATDALGLVTLPERDNEVRVTSSTGGQKGRKLARYDLIPVHPWWDVAELYGFGTRKYADRNWERGYDWSLSYAAMMRHAQQFWDRESLDKETGSPHLAAVVFHALALLEFSATHPEFDDRPGR